MVAESKVDVLVVGAGPAGVMCATALAHAGIHVRIIDKRPFRVPFGQADGIQPRTIEVLQSYGLAGRLLAEGQQIHTTVLYRPGQDGEPIRHTKMINISSPSPPRFPFEVALNQGAVEQIFRDSMTIHGVNVEQSTVPISIDISDGEKLSTDPNVFPVKVVLNHIGPQTANGSADQAQLHETEGHTEVVRAKFVVGCDGAHSWVRKYFGIKHEGDSRPTVWGVVDVKVEDTTFPDIRAKGLISTQRGAFIFVSRENDKVRFYVERPDIEVGIDGKLDRTDLGAEKTLENVRDWFQPYTIVTPEPPEWWTHYIIGQRLASSFSAKNRVFIAGDACHTHSPKGGQGANASMNDSHNLAWKLAYVLRGWAKPSILDTYQFERRSYAQDLIDFDRVWSAVLLGKPREEDIPEGMSHQEFLVKSFGKFGAFMSGIAVQYQPSLITNPSAQHVAPNLIIGQRVPPQIVLCSADTRPYELQDLLPSDARLKLLLLTGNTNDPKQRERIEAVADKLNTLVLTKFTPPGEKFGKVFDIITISKVPKLEVNYMHIPAILRAHWSKAFTDDVDFNNRDGGTLYKDFGVQEDGAFVVVRPDGYVGTVTALENVEGVEEYLSAFMVAH